MNLFTIKLGNVLVVKYIHCESLKDLEFEKLIRKYLTRMQASAIKVGYQRLNIHIFIKR